MDRRRFVVTAASFGAVAAAVAAGCAQRFGPNYGTSFSLAGIAPSNTNYKLKTKYAVYEIGGKKLRTRTYNGAIPGPTMHAHVGQYLNVEIQNRLPKNIKAPCPPPGTFLVPDVRTEEEAMEMPKRYVRATGQPDCMNNPHDFNTTNLHVHGIQTTPHLFEPIGTQLAASEMIAVNPGKNFRYHLPVPANHPSGLHWYHPHHHGSTDVQVGGGMAGLIVVHGPIDEVPEIAAARQIFLVVQSLTVNKSKTTPNLYELEYVPYEPESKGGYYVDTKFVMYTVALETENGRQNAVPVSWFDRDAKTFTPYPAPSFDVRPGEVVRLRLLNGTNQDTLPLIFPGVEAWQIGFDGVNLLTPTLKDMSGKVDGGKLTPMNFINAPVRMTVPGNRIEFLIRAPETPGTYTLSSKNAEALHGPDADIALLNLVVSGTKKSMNIPKELPKPDREYFPVPENPFKRTFTFSFKEDKTGRILTGFNFLVNDVLYMETDVPTYVPLGSVEEWEIRNTTGAIHPFHIHVNSFQLLEINGVPNETPEVWDTFYVPPKSSVSGPYGSIKIRIKFQEFTGKSVFHCHFLSHEDTGMMQNFTIH